MNPPKGMARKIIFLLYFSLLIVIPSLSQVDQRKTWIALTSRNPSNPETKLLASDIRTSRIEIITPGFWKENIRAVDGKTESLIYTDNSTPQLTKGAPDLGKLTASLAIPDLSKMELNIIDEEYFDLPDYYIIPSKGNLTRNVNPDEVPYEYGPEYNLDAFFPGETAELRPPHIIRDVRGQVVVIYPFRYNPVQHILRVYSKLVIEIRAVSEDGENPLSVRKDDGKSIRTFVGIYERNFMNYSEYQSASRYTPLEEDGNMLIISYGPFMTDIQEFADWKNISGIPAEIVNVSSIGTTAAQIKTFVTDYYTNNGLTYLLLVGDAAQVPASSTSAGPSDNNYGYIVGNDHYPDIFVGRFSAETNAQVLTQVQRTIDYETDPDITQGSFLRSMCIASNQGPGDDGEYDWQHERNIRSDYMDYTYSYGAELYDGSQGGQDVAGNPTPAMVTAEINTGTGVISYTGHGSTVSWGTTGFSNTNVNALSNNNKLPFIFSVACLNGNFTASTCFAEAWLRATSNGQPSGAIAVVMSTINQSWNPPMQGQDEMVDILTEVYPANIKRSFGGICMNGCMNMNDVYGSAGAEMTDTWTVFGDPSLMVRTADPEEMIVTHVNVLPYGSGQITIYCDQEEARAAVSHDGQLLGCGYIINGASTINFDPIDISDTLTIAVTAFNKIPYIASSVYFMPPACWLGYTNEWNNTANWSDGIIPGSSSQVIIPETLMGDYYPSVFTGNLVIQDLNMENGANLSVPTGVTITVGTGQ